MKLSSILLLLALILPATAQRGVLRPPPIRPGAEPPDIPLATPDPAFPLRLHIFNVRWGGLATRNHGYGTLNLLDPAGPKGFDFGFDCDFPFVQNETPAETYQARWKKQPYELEILTVEVDLKHAHACKLQLAPENHPFDPANLVKFTHGVSSSLRVRWSDPDFAYEFADPAYPLQFHVIDTERREGLYTDTGGGVANLADPVAGTPLQSADFSYECDYGFLPNSQRETYYQARWIKPGARLEILLQRPGSAKIDRCQVDVALKLTP